jgi:hypothetical protein
MVEEGARRRSIIQLHFAGKFLAFASKSIRLSSCLSQTRPMAAFDIQARSEAEPGTEGPVGFQIAHPAHRLAGRGSRSHK